MSLEVGAAIAAVAMLIPATVVAWTVCIGVVRRRITTPDEMTTLVDPEEALTCGVLCAGGFVGMTIGSKMTVDPISQMLMVLVTTASAGAVARIQESAAVAWVLRSASLAIPICLGLAGFT